MTYSELREDVESNRHIFVNGHIVSLFEYRNRQERRDFIAGVILLAFLVVAFYAAAYIGG